MKYLISERESVNSYREPIAREFKNIRAAKISATKNKAFFGTVLCIENERGDLLAYKYDSKRWENLR